MKMGFTLDDMVEDVKKARGQKLYDIVLIDDPPDPAVAIILEKGRLYIGMNNNGVYWFEYVSLEEAEKDA